MINSLTSIAAIENVLMKLKMKQKLFIYQIARLEYQIYKSLFKLNEINLLIAEEEQNLISLISAIKAAGEGKVADKLIAWKTKAEYKLFKLNLRKRKIDVVKIVINQSKLEQYKLALEEINKTIQGVENQEVIINKSKEVSCNVIQNKVDRSMEWEKIIFNKHPNPINQSIDNYLQKVFKMAS